jgi:hypothetical protein
MIYRVIGIKDPYSTKRKTVEIDCVNYERAAKVKSIVQFRGYVAAIKVICEETITSV